MTSGGSNTKPSTKFRAPCGAKVSASISSRRGNDGSPGDIPQERRPAPVPLSRIPKPGAGDEGKKYAGQDSARKGYAGAEPGQSEPADTRPSCLGRNQEGGKPSPSRHFRSSESVFHNFAQAIRYVTARKYRGNKTSARQLATRLRIDINTARKILYRLEKNVEVRRDAIKREIGRAA